MRGIVSACSMSLIASIHAPFSALPLAGAAIRFSFLQLRFSGRSASSDAMMSIFNPAREKIVAYFSTTMSFFS